MIACLPPAMRSVLGCGVWRRVVAFMILLLGASSGVRAGEDGPAPAALEKAFCDWWDTLPFPSLQRSPFVRYQNGDGWGGEHWGDRSGFRYGFLMAEREGRAVVFTTDLQFVPVVLGTARSSRDEARNAEPIDFERFVRRGLAAIAGAPEDTAYYRRPDPFGAHHWEIPNQAFRLAVLARACAARGHAGLAHRMFEQARRELAYGRDTVPASKAFESFKSDIASEAGDGFEGRFSDVGTSWSELAAQAHRFALAFGWKAPDYLETLDAMAAGDARRRAQRLAWTEMSSEERISDAIARLQHVTESFFSDLPSDTPDDGGADPVRALLEIGEPAVPGLIDALGDARFTRSVYVLLTSGHAQYRDSQEVGRVGPLARSILRRIAQDEGLDESEGVPERDEQEEDTSATAARLRALWARAATRDRFEVARRTVATGTRGFRARARWLAARSPEQATAAIAEGLRASPNSWVTTELSRELSRVPGDAPLALLRQRLAQAANLEDCLAAAWALAVRGERDGIAPMARAWRQAADDALRDADFHVGDPVAFLAESGDPEAVRALADRLGEREATLRHRVVGALLPAAQRTKEHTAETRSPWPHVGASASVAPSTEELIETLLGGRLEDAGETHPNLSWGLCDPSLDHRTAHAAAQVLSARYPDRYRFPLGPYGVGRALALAQVRNAYRARRSLPPLPLPPSFPEATPADPARVGPLLDRVVAAQDAATRSAALAALESLGRGAVGAILARLSALDREHALRASLTALASRLSSTVADLRFASNGLAPTEALKAHAEGLRGQPLDGLRFVGLFLHVVRSLPPGAVGLRVRVERPQGASGLVLELTLLTAPPGATLPLSGQMEWSVSALELHAGRWGDVGRSMGGWWSHSLGEEESWLDVFNDVDEALAEPADVEVFAEMTVARSGS